MKTMTLLNSDGASIANAAVESWSVPQDDPFSFGTVTLVPDADVALGSYRLRDGDGRIVRVFISAHVSAGNATVALGHCA
jgi:hypothetical protein